MTANRAKTHAKNEATADPVRHNPDVAVGIDVIGQVREQYADIPVMMITNFEEHQQLAIDAGAVRGFGKNAVNSRETIDLLSGYLA